ncbi:helix-turn-helix domain-containing protein [Listeria monocytogenes]|uniref:helix-turn-helix domain-containing protein n=1 Tax=Listeria monocytogenes TaxID=1639 RepID=UPI00124908C4|nr:helix-turn-helix domain-containing protein [Listeria monocytogenes]KAA9557683.1 XRE family transcriptional regulator [Listeria monocytogenes]
MSVEHTRFAIEVSAKLKSIQMQQKDLAKLLKISDAYLSDIINGKRNAPKMRKQIVEILELDKTLV